MTNETLTDYVGRGGYKGISVNKATDKTEWEEAVLHAAVANLDMPVSDEEIDMKLDGFIASEKIRINADPIYHVLADFTAILDQTYRATNVTRSQAQIQSEALDIMLLTLSKDQEQVSKDYFYQLLKELAHGYRDLPADFDEKLDAIIERRKKENEEKSDDEKIDDAFSAYLGTISQTEQMWRNNQRLKAEEYVKRDKLYDAVTEQEHIEAAEDEIIDMIKHMAAACNISYESIADAVDPSPVAWQIRRDKARELILREAKND